MVTAVGPVAVTVLNALQRAIAVDVAAAVIPRHQRPRLEWLYQPWDATSQPVGTSIRD